MHAGTHIDSPHHFVRSAGGVETLPLDALVGEAIVLDLAAKGKANARIGPDDLDAAEQALAAQGIRIEPEGTLFLRTDWPKNQPTTSTPTRS